MKRMLFTGASGFLGNSIRPILSHHYDVTSLGIAPEDDIVADISSMNTQLKYFDTVLHAAGLAHVPGRTEDEKKRFYEINYKGTVNLCEALDKKPPQSLIFISTVAVYGREEGVDITEDHPLNGITPYAESKILAEKHLKQWCAQKNVILTILRPSLIAGPVPPGNLGAMINGISKNRYLSIGGGRARKSVLMVQDIANLVLLAEGKGGIYNVCDDGQPTFRELEEIIAAQLGKKMPLDVPYPVAKCLALAGDLLGRRAPINSDKLQKIVKDLTFSNVRAKKELGW